MRDKIPRGLEKRGLNRTFQPRSGLSPLHPSFPPRPVIIQDSMPTFVEQLESYVHEKLASLDLLKEPQLGNVDRSEIVRRLKMALKNELEASEIAAVWIPTTPEVDV